MSESHNRASVADALGLLDDTNAGRCTFVIAGRGRCPMVASGERDRCDAHPRPSRRTDYQAPETPSD